ncbi:MAG: hypothetical protein ABI843_09675 [Dokdonella sp.]
MLEFVPDMYPGGIVRALLNKTAVAHYYDGPGPTQIRWYHIEHRAPGWLETCDSVADAQARIRAWVAGLDIEPWDEPTGTG